MSLAVLADHMASKGRGPDSMLIHMSPREVQGLQALAVKNGGSLTINPETGLPEAGFLDKLLPAIIGFALAPMTAGTSLAFLGASPMAAALTVGGLQTLRTGDLGKGIMAGFGAYGGAGLGASLAGAGTGAMSAEVGGAALSNAGLTGEAALTAEADQIAQRAIGEKLAASTPFETMATGANQVTSSPEAMKQFAGKNWRAGLSAISPVLADQAVKSNMPTTTTRPGAVRTYSYNPYEQLYTPTGNYEVPVKAANGGLMGMDDGGYSPGQLNFAERSEPVVRMAVGGTPPTYNSVEDLYKNILGREGEAEGLAFWKQGFGDTIDPNEVASFQQAAQAELARRPAAEQQQLAPNLVAANTATTGGVTNLATTGGLDTLAAANNITALQPQATTQKQSVLPPPAQTSLADAQAQVNNMYRNVLGRDADPTGLNFWSNAIASGRSAESVYQDFLTSARANTELVTADQIKNKTFAEATTPYKGYMQTNATDASNIVDDWVRNTLGREPTNADRQQQWYKDAFTSMSTQGQAKGLYDQFLGYAGTEAAKTIANRKAEILAELKAKGLTEADLVTQTKKTIDQLANEGIDLGRNLIGASQLAPVGGRTTYDLKAKLAELKPIPNTSDGSVVARSVTNPYGNATNPGDLTFNPDGTTTVTPNIPYRPAGGFPDIGSVKNAWTQGGGSLGYIPYAPKTIEEFDAKYNKLTGGSKEAYDRLTGKTEYSPVPYTKTGEVMKPYSESVLGVPRSLSSKKVLFDPATRTYKNNPDYIPVSYTDKGEKVYGLSSKNIAAQLPDMPKSDYEKWVRDNNVTHAQIAEALGISLAEAKKRYPISKEEVATEAEGGLLGLAGGGMAGQFDLGGYSDGGRLLRGPGDGVSDSIPATIGNKRPARLADGEFVVPARIVSELGNGSTEAGARKLYAMMNRVQAARRGTVGKGRVAKNSRSDKYLPA